MQFKVHKIVSALPSPLEANALYLIRVGAGFDLYCSDTTGSVAHKINGITVTDSNTIDFTLTGQDITAGVKAGSITTTELSTAINTSLGKADTAIQNRLETVVLLLTPPETNLALDTDLPAINAFPYAMNITSVRADVGVAPTGSTLIVDMKKNGASMMTAKFSIDAGEFSSTTAASLPVLSASTLAVGDKLSFSIDQIGATVAGQYLTVTINGERV